MNSIDAMKLKAKFNHAKRSHSDEGQLPRIRLSQCRPVHTTRLSIGKRFAAMYGFALGPLELSVKIEPAVYSELIRDPRISHGAFRIWHLLRDMTGNNSCCWPSVRTIAELTHCAKESALAWIVELEASGYLRIERGHRHKANRYFVGGSKSYHGGRKDYPIGGRKDGTELNPVIQSKNSGRAACVKAQPPALPEAKKELRAPDALLKSLVQNLYAANKLTQ